MGDEKTAPCHVDEAVLSDPANEENDSLSYYFNATAHLLNVLYSDDKLRRSPMAEQVIALVRFWNAEPSERDNTVRTAQSAVPPFSKKPMAASVRSELGVLCQELHNAEFERDLIHERTVAGLAAARTWSQGWTSAGAR